MIDFLMFQITYEIDFIDAIGTEPVCRPSIAEFAAWLYGISSTILQIDDNVSFPLYSYYDIVLERFTKLAKVSKYFAKQDVL